MYNHVYNVIEVHVLVDIVPVYELYVISCVLT